MRVAGTAFVAVVLASCGVSANTDVSPVAGEGRDPVAVEALPDGEVFGFVVLGSTTVDERVVLSVDVADLLSGPEAHDAAVADGYIGVDEELPNDVYIDNVDHDVVTIAMRPDAHVVVQLASPEAELATVTVGPDDLYEIVDGHLRDAAVYGVIPGEPIAMTLTIERGFVAAAEFVHLP